MRWAAGPGMRLLPLRQGVAVSGSDDVRAVFRVVEVRRVGGLVAAHAGSVGNLALDERTRGVLHVMAPRPMTVLALHVASPDSLSFDAGPAELGAIDPADASRLLPPGDVAADAIEAVLLLDRDQRGVCAGVLGLRPEGDRVLVALDASGDPEESALALRRRRAGLRLPLRFRKIELRHLVVVGIDELLRILVRPDLSGERQERGAHPRRSRARLRRGRRRERALALLQLADLRLQLIAALRRRPDLRAKAFDARVETPDLLFAVLRRRQKCRRAIAEMDVDAQEALSVPFDREQRRESRILGVRVGGGIVAAAEDDQIDAGRPRRGKERLRSGERARSARVKEKDHDSRALLAQAAAARCDRRPGIRL